MGRGNGKVLLPAVAATAFFLLTHPGGGVARAGTIRSPHSAEACLDCHRGAAVKESGRSDIPTIVIPDFPDPHRVLRDTCIGCHPEGVPPFWIMVLPGGSPVPPSAAAAPPSAAAAQATSAAGRPTFDNAHDDMECNECHAAKVAFNKVTGREGELVEKKGDMTDFCLRCHEEITAEHFPPGSVPTAKTTCLSCHQVHHPTSISPALREDFYDFIRNARDVNPHGGAAFCLACHPNKPLAGEPAELLVRASELSRLCLRCHTDNAHHVIDKPAGTGTWKMTFLKWPLQNNAITCLTCHRPHGVGPKNEGFSPYALRGEPYKRLTDFCQKCHEQREWAKLNAHDQLTAEGQAINRTCLFCHDGVPDSGQRGGLGPTAFNDTLTAVCTQCHEPYPHPEGEHLLIPSAGMTNSMQDYEKKRDVSLPLDFNGRITCVTCHNPHEKGLLTGPSAVGADEQVRLRLTTFNEICTPCHGRK